MIDNLKLAAKKRAWRDNQYSKCEFKPLEDGQYFPEGRKVVLWYPSGKKAEGGYVDAEWSQRIEIHHITDGKCLTYYTERSHDGIEFSEDYDMGVRPKVSAAKVQRDGATQLLIFSPFTFHNYQAFEIRGAK